MRKRSHTIFQQATRFRRGERGVQLVEVAIVLPVLLVLLAATAEFGRYFYLYSTLSRATRTAVRHVSSKPFTTSYKTEAINLALCGSTTTCSSGSEILSGLTTSNFNITSTGTSTNFPTTVTVQVVNYTYTPLFNLGSFVSGLSWTSVPVSTETTMRYMLSN
jgi:Flp pilus assembly protein TadG